MLIILKLPYNDFLSLLKIKFDFQLNSGIDNKTIVNK